MQKRLVIITCVNDDKKMLEFNINLTISKNYNITSVNGSLKANLTLYFMINKFKS
jgi:hypothetical protein